MLTLVVESARARDMVKSVHIARLKRRFRPKKEDRIRSSIRWFEGLRWRNVERVWDQDVVREVVVLWGLVGWRG